MTSLVPPNEFQESFLKGNEVKSKKSRTRDRGTWTKQIDFFLTLCGGSVGLGNVWRFPYLCYKHGGGAFLIPYFLCVILGGIPLLVIEIGIGQFTGRGPITAWTMISPLFKGIGVACLVVESLLNTYYVVIMAWGLYYLFWSFRAVLPYSTCDNAWNTPCCLPSTNVITNVSTMYGDNDTVYELDNVMMGSTMNTSEECRNETTSPTVEFWNRKVLQIHLSDGIDDIGQVNCHVLLCLLLAWVFIYLCICKGVKSSGKVVYFTVPFPYILLTILLVRAVTLPNAIEGIIFYLKPDVKKLKESQVWLDAATQIFFSNSLGQGVLVALGSYNKKTHNFVRDTLMYSAINSATSFYAGFVIFAVLGFMSGVQGKPVGDVASSGPGLGFIAYPEAITQTPLSPLWAILFFLTLLFLGIDSQFVCVEGFITTVVDLYPRTLLRGYRREMFCAVVCAVYCILAIPMVTNGGMYVFQLFDYYSCSGFVLLWIAIFESTVISWVYGGRRFMRNVAAMTGMGWISPYMIGAWMFGTPMFAAKPYRMSTSMEAEKDDVISGMEKETGSGDGPTKARGAWTRQIDFFLALCGASVGLGNVWRFPYLCYKHGGGAFLVPYFLCLLLGGIPLLMIEIGLGQLTGQGPVTAWGMISPLFKGIGVAGLVIQALLDTYYAVIMAWGLYYLFWSFRAVLPYSTCDNAWNTPCCVTTNDVTKVNATSGDNSTAYDLTTGSVLNSSEECGNKTTSATVEFWNRKVLQIHLSDGIHDVGPVNWQLLLCLLLAWVFIYLCICKGVKSSGKVVYFTVPFPYILLTILLIRAVTLPNATEGIIFYLKPNVTRLQESQVWLDAATQIFYSNSLGHGVMVALGSFNARNHNFVRDTLVYSLINSGTSLYAGFVIFAVLGFMASKQGISVEEVASSGPGLGFIAYPEAITQMPLSTLWAILFFLTLLFLGIDSQFVCVEGFITTVVDLCPRILLRGRRREIFCAVVCFIFCILAIPMVTHGGMYVFQLFDYYAASGFVLLWIAMFESCVIGWVYGGRRFMRDIVEMTGMGWIAPYMLFTWMFATPLFAATIFLYSLIAYQPLKYEDVYTYPWWGYMIGIMMAVSSMINIPIFIFYQLIFKSEGSFRERWALLTTSRVPHHVTSKDEKENCYLQLEVR